jgi:cytochrome subunit of sulfide dehydrogenase
MILKYISEYRNANDPIRCKNCCVAGSAPMRDFRTARSGKYNLLNLNQIIDYLIDSVHSLIFQRVRNSFPLRGPVQIPGPNRETPFLTVADADATVATRPIRWGLIMRSALALFIAAKLLCPATAAAEAMDPNLARSIAATCANCHGTNGVSRGDIASLAGLAKDDIVRKMQEFKTGARSGTIMPQLAKGYTDAQIELAAGWFAAQKAAK